jgi:hypothetical protein
MLLGSLGVSETTGVTNLAGTVVRIALGEGTLVIEVDDPSIEISLDGEELTITGAGIQELRLRPGQYEFQATKDGAPVQTELISIIRGDRQVVRVARVPSSPTQRSIQEANFPGAFIVLRPDGGQAGKFDTLADAVLGSSPGDTIEIRGNGPFVTVPIVISRPLTIRAGNGFRPVIQGDPKTTLSWTRPLLASNSLLVLEGLDLEYASEHGRLEDPYLLVSTGRLHALNSRFSCRGEIGTAVCCSNGHLRNCVVTESRETSRGLADCAG